LVKTRCRHRDAVGHEVPGTACSSLPHHTSSQRNAASGKAPGPSGWTAEALCQQVDELDVRQGMLALVGAIMNNIVPPDLRYLLVARDLCLVPKLPVPRPIAKGNVFVKLALRIAYQRISL
jgi:hypothetical protein